MSEELKLKFLALGLLSASAIGGEACKDCPHNIPRMSAALLTGDGEALRDCAKLLFKDCELVPVGTKARIAELEQMAEAHKLANRLLEQERNELEAERDRLREALKEVLNCEVVTDTGDYSKGGTGFDCNEVKEIVREALKGAGECRK